MNRIERAYLKKGSSISLLSATDIMEEAIFKILNMEAEDCYTVRYQAETNGNVGNLIELYPLDSPDSAILNFLHMNRCKDGELKPISDAMGCRFSEIKKSFFHSYELLSEQVQKSLTCNENFYHFVPPYQLYDWKPDTQNSSCDLSCNIREFPRTSYLWIQERKKRKCLEDYIKDLQKNAGKNAKQKAAEIISTILYITQCIEYMHCAGLLHLNICPSNFAIEYDENFQVQKGHISMNIVSAFFEPGNEYPISIGTGIYMAPEIGILPPDNRADLYSIGVMLYQAFFNQTSEILKTGYPMDKFHWNKNLLFELYDSPMIRNLGENTSYKFVSHIKNILYHCLQMKREDRYASCDELISDLRLALAYIG